LAWLRDYRDRDRNTGQDANWSHVYGDLEQLKARHAIPPKTVEEPNDYLAIELLALYFGEDKKKMFAKNKSREHLTGSNENKAVISWIENMIQVGWQLCSSI